MENQKDELAEFRDQKIKDEIEGIANALAEVSDSDGPYLAEVIFVSVFLPFFAGDKETKYKVGMQHWINTAGSPFSAVKVVDQRNVVLFTVPPIYDRSAIQPVNKDLGSIANVVASAGQLTRLHPSQGTHYLNAELTKRALIMNVPTNVLQHIEVWNEIFKRYGREPIVPLHENEAKSKPSDKPEEGLDYDFQPL